VQHQNVISPLARGYKGDVMSIRDTLAAELETAKSAYAELQTKISSLEAQLENIPAELQSLEEDAFARIKAWFSSVV
jgi:chromosome segregation ATPase